ncbi:histidine kinase [Methylovorus sp. MM2]|uniref:HAMP domain-containing sensor histidine kinase n=1 Tax=Methylovorus sp. MM2 TaxID=1848038 RepID=UPI0007DFF87D|nr:HAMP domain-containing sensor histidine kinase [Methylovorus sp. MM2]OAM53220.1 histidine kinase [Methylovorus sp. MM2]
MRIAYPKSFLKLLLLGFTLAMLPLLFAFGNAALYLDRLAEQSLSTVNQSVQATRSSKSLVEQLTLMERSARQFFVLHDNQLLENFTHAHTQFGMAIKELEKLSVIESQHANLQDLRKKETSLYDDIVSHPPEPQTINAAISRFIDLSSQAQNILAENNNLIDQAAIALAKTSELTQKMLIFQTLTLLPVALLVAAVITYLVAQPIRRMDAAIRRLGEGDYHEPISIDGPGDLHSLGERLDWLRAQLEELEQQKQRFLRHVSHELKTPLTAIREASELLNDEVGGSLSPQQKEIASILRESSLRLQKMIENLLNYTAVQFQKPQLRLEIVKLIPLTKSILADYALTLSGKHIEIKQEFHDGAMIGDTDKLHNVFDNLISNAIKYTPPFGKITIRIMTVDESTVFEIHDGGPGVMAADKAKLFDPFYRGNGVYESLVSGSGLGLSIAKEYVDAHGGEITLLPSEQGAHFSVRLPLKPIDLEPS